MNALFNVIIQPCASKLLELGQFTVSTNMSVDQIVEEWGIGLGVRITEPVAKAAHFVRGLPIKVEVVEGGILLRAIGKPKLTLTQKLKVFNPSIHSGELMASGRIGAEDFEK
jgi:antitoxin MazE